MKEFTYKIKDELGIHARPAGLLVKETSKFVSEIIIEKGEKIGEIILTLNGETLGKTALIAHNTVLKKNTYRHFTEIMKSLFI